MLLELAGVSSFYGDAQALWDVSLSLGHGEVLAVVGANGAGKSTVLRTISGLVPARSGRVTFEGSDIGALPPSRLIGRGIAHVPEGRRLFGSMSVYENLMVGAYGAPSWPERARVVEEVFALFPRLAERRRQAAGSMSGGEQQMCAIGRALMSRPRVLLLDEPSLGLAPKMIDAIFDALAAIHKDGASMLLVEQNARLALDFAERAAVMAHGRVVASAAAAELREGGQLRAAYLGM